MGQQHADVLYHLGVVLVELVHLPEEVEAAAALPWHYHLQGRQLWGWGGAFTPAAVPRCPLASGVRQYLVLRVAESPKLRIARTSATGRGGQFPATWGHLRSVCPHGGTCTPHLTLPAEGSCPRGALSLWAPEVLKRVAECAYSVGAGGTPTLHTYTPS